MNILFHTTTSIAISSYTSAHYGIHKRMYIALFFSGILAHGVLDILPHSYPIKSIYDLMISSVLISVIVFLMHNTYRVLYLISFLGNITPDLIDLGPRLLFKMFSFGYPIPPLFPWHDGLSGSIYSTEPLRSILAHGAVLAICAIVIARNFSKKFNMR